MVDYNFDELIEEVGRRLKAYCEELDDPDCFSGRLMLSIEPAKLFLNSVTDIKNLLQGLLSPQHSASSHIFIISDNLSGKKVLSFYYGKKSEGWIIDLYK